MMYRCRSEEKPYQLVGLFLRLGCPRKGGFLVTKKVTNTTNYGHF